MATPSMRPAAWVGAGLVLLGGAATALGQEMALPAEITPTAATPGGAESAPGLESRLLGFLDSRMVYTGVAVDRVAPANDLPALANLTEGNLQLKLTWGERAVASADTSFVWQKGAVFRGADKNGDRVGLADHDVPALHPAALVSELYGTWNGGEHWHVTLGKKRVVWGPGLALNPTDLLNPPKDPTDPAMQRAGSWLARVEAPFETWTLSIVAAAKVTQQFGGLPSGLVWHTDAQQTEASKLKSQSGLQAVSVAGIDAEPHFALASRLYLLWHETDLDAYAYLTHLYNDAFRYKPRFGLSASRVVLDALELHVEALAQTGSARRVFDAACFSDLGSVLGCVGSGKAPAALTRLEDGQWRAKALAGGRWMFENQAMLSVEYFLNLEGYDADEFSTFAKAAVLLRDAMRQGLPVPLQALGFGSGAGDPGSPQKFAFEPMRRHYAFVTYLQPQIADDFTLSAVLLVGLEDLSGQFTPSAAWSVRQWLTWTVTGFVGVPGIGALGVDTTAGRVTEFGMLPAQWRAMTSLRAFF
ncbi:MAG: hypothetical protein EXR79_12635 [Myxococcales bacterium]|nr:hypothetical protein [Myxococcales bacterium]